MGSCRTLEDNRQDRPRRLAAFAQHIEWLKAFCTKWKIPLDAYADGFLDMGAWFDVRGHQRAVKLNEKKLAETQQRVDRLLRSPPGRSWSQKKKGRRWPGRSVRL